MVKRANPILCQYQKKEIHLYSVPTGIGPYILSGNYYKGNIKGFSAYFQDVFSLS